MSEPNPDKCSNPYFECLSNRNAPIAVDIQLEEKRYPICKTCWAKLASARVNWKRPNLHNE